MNGQMTTLSGHQFPKASQVILPLAWLSFQAQHLIHEMAAANLRTGQGMGNREIWWRKHALSRLDRDSPLEQLWTDEMADGSFTNQGAQEQSDPCRCLLWAELPGALTPRGCGEAGPVFGARGVQSVISVRCWTALQLHPRVLRVFRNSASLADFQGEVFHRPG